MPIFIYISSFLHTVYFLVILFCFFFFLFFLLDCLLDILDSRFYIFESLSRIFVPIVLPIIFILRICRGNLIYRLIVDRFDRMRNNIVLSLISDRLVLIDIFLVNVLTGRRSGRVLMNVDRKIDNFVPGIVPGIVRSGIVAFASFE